MRFTEGMERPTYLDDHVAPENVWDYETRIDLPRSAPDSEGAACRTGTAVGGMNAERLALASTTESPTRRMQSSVSAASCWISPCAARLVEQDPADEPASELLKRIEAEKEPGLVKSGEIKNASQAEMSPATRHPVEPFDEAEWMEVVTDLDSVALKIVGRGAQDLRPHDPLIKECLFVMREREFHG